MASLTGVPPSPFSTAVALLVFSSATDFTPFKSQSPIRRPENALLPYVIFVSRSSRADARDRSKSSNYIIDSIRAVIWETRRGDPCPGISLSPFQRRSPWNPGTRATGGSVCNGAARLGEKRDANRSPARVPTERETAPLSTHFEIDARPPERTDNFPPCSPERFISSQKNRRISPRTHPVHFQTDRKNPRRMQRSDTCLASLTIPRREFLNPRQSPTGRKGSHCDGTKLSH